MTRIFPIELPVPQGQLCTMARPLGDEQLLPYLQELKTQGVDLLVGLLELEEMGELGLLQEKTRCEQVGISFIHFPIADFSVVEDKREVNRLCRQIQEALTEGKKVVVHCRMGIGRSSSIAAITLIKMGFAPKQVWAAISKARGLQVPDTEAQKQWVNDFANH